MSQRIDKKLVRERFRKSMTFNNYCKNASVQDMMAEYLLQNLEAFTESRSFHNIFEQGSGTGILTKKLLSKYNPVNFIANDIVDDSEVNVADNTDLEAVAVTVATQPTSTPV